MIARLIRTPRLNSSTKFSDKARMLAEPLTPATQRLIERDFPLEHRAEVTGLLLTRCGSNLPLMGETSAAEIERVRFAVLKLTGGRIEDLQRHVDIANVDWRD